MLQTRYDQIFNKPLPLERKFIESEKSLKLLLGCPRKMWKSLEKNGSALKSDELTNYKLVDRENLSLNFDSSFVKIG